MTFDPDPILDGLKGFQRDTVEYVFERYFGADPVDRFLVADEVGLGKTMVARGLIAKLIAHHLQEEGRRIDIVYICSNQAIAQQNFSKLALVGRRTKAITDRITTLPLHVGGLEQQVPGFDRGINVIPITPTTSLDLRSSEGRADERALLWWLLKDERLGVSHLMHRKGAKRVFQPPVPTLGHFQWRLDRINASAIDEELWTHFVQRVHEHPEEGPPIAEEIAELADAFRSERRLGEEPWKARRARLVSRLRRILAGACVRALEPDLVILDEFQRFPKLMDPTSATGELAERLFAFPGCKTLLLSATPYRMFSRAQELDEDHYRDFIETTKFLLDDPARAEALERDMAAYRVALRAAGSDGTAAARKARNAIRSQLMRVMSRTERLGADGDRNGMLEATPTDQLRPKLSSKDLRAYAELEQVAEAVESRDVVEFWKSAPYPLNLMDDYQLAEKFEAQADGVAPLAIKHRLSPNQLRRYRKIDPGNARLRALLERLDSDGAWKRLWVAPSMPYYKAGRPFSESTFSTKRLVFSSWQVVPKAIAALTSYEVERKLVDAADAGIRNTPAGRERLGAPLQWRQGGALTEALMIVPGRQLARLTDPLALAAEAEDTGLVERSLLIDRARRAVRSALEPLRLPRDRGGRPDPRWYLVALLRMEGDGVEDWLTTYALGDGQYSPAWTSHVRRLHMALVSDDELGAVPDDLGAVLAYLGFAGPGACALRALERIASPEVFEDVQGHALRVANGMRQMFNLPEAVLAVRAFTSSRSTIQTSGDDVYWRSVLDYCAAGNLQAVLDEYAHALKDWVGGSSPTDRLRLIADGAIEAMGVQAAALPIRNIRSDGRVEQGRVRLRSRFALRLDRGQTEDQQSVQRVDTVRKAFNSPFWPFVLATTSVGQEGLDFHHYSHAVVHWNLPHNPVDLEQREGRVHRFKNHAVRKNLATAHREDGLAAAPDDPWQAMFDAAQSGDRGLKPYWVFTGDAKIERHVPAEPMSSDQYRLEELVRLMGVYRLAFGQPRQDELLAALGSLDGEAQDLVVDLTPPEWRLSQTG